MSPVLDPLNDVEVSYLHEILIQKNSGDIRGFPGLDGMLAATVCSPDLIHPAEYLSLILGGETEEDDLVFEDEEKNTKIFTLTMRHYATLLDQLSSFGTKENGDTVVYTPGLFADENGKIDTEEWAKGFLVGVGLRYEIWEPFLDFSRYDEHEESPLLGVLLLAYENHPDPKIRPFKKPLTDEMRANILAAAVHGIAHIFDKFTEESAFGFPDLDEFDLDEFDLDEFVSTPATFVHETPKVGRNDPCPCGSGKKFKKCCANLKIGS